MAYIRSWVFGGLLALLTPCVFPMIPLTVSFFTKKAADESAKSGLIKAVLYGVFIVLVYLILSAPFHLLDSVNPDILNEISTNVWLNIIFFAIFVFFAFSFFGYYELTLPASWTSVTSKGEGFGGILGSFSWRSHFQLCHSHVQAPFLDHFWQAHFLLMEAPGN